MNQHHVPGQDLPSGLLTFVFTDIEASTRLYKALGEEAAGEVFDLHNDLLRASWAAFGGHEVHTEGDSFFVVFEDQEQAVDACLDVQRRITAADWPPNGRVRVRIGMHCGLAAPRHGDYMALAVHQAARVMSAANGGQILATDAVIDRVQRRADRVTTSCGAFRLRDFDQAPTLFRIDDASAGEPNDRPPRAVPADHHNLVMRLTSFVGRQADLVAVNAMIEPGRAVSIVGLGGMGKTRLATEVGLDVADSWPDGVWMVELAGVFDPELIADQVAVAIGAGSGSAGDRWHDVLEFIGHKGMLLVLDNVEHLVDRVAQLLPELLRSCPNSAVLCTSREPVNCQGEFVYRLQPLATVASGVADDDAASLDDGSPAPSVQLFLDRALSVVPGRRFDADDLDLVGEICAHLDGLPLAIEVAAAQVAMLQPSEILAGLDDRFRLLRSRDRALPDRQRTMEGLLGWSYQLLDENEQRAFRRLAVFGGSFSIDAAEAALTGAAEAALTGAGGDTGGAGAGGEVIAAGGEVIVADDVPELIWSLVDKSLIAADLTSSATRYRLFESVQQYALQRLIDNDDPVRCADALARWLLERVGPWLVNDRRWLGDVAVEAANIRNVVDLIAASEPEKAQQLMCTLGRYHDTVQSYQVGIDELTRAAGLLPHRGPSRVALLADTAHLHVRMGHVGEAAALLDEAAELQRTVGPPDWNDVAIERVRGDICIRARDYEQAIELARNALAGPISAQGQARMWSLIGIAEASRDNLDAGLDALQSALDIYTELGDAPHLALAHANVAEAAWRRELFDRAARHQRFCLQDALVIGQRLAIATSLYMAGYLAELRENWPVAIQVHAKADAMMAESGHQPYDEVAAAVAATRRRAAAAIGDQAVDDALRQGPLLDVIDASELAFATFDHEIAIASATPGCTG